MHGIQSLVDEVTKHLRCLRALDKDPFTSRLPVRHPSGVKLPRASTVSSGWVQANSSQALALKHIERVGSVDGTQHRAMRHAGLGKSQNGSPPDCACVRTRSAFSTPARKVDHYYDFVTGPMRRNATGPVALETLLSWVVCGKPRPGPVAEKRVLLTKIEEPTNASLRRFWEVEAMGINPEDDAEPEDARMVEKFEDSLSFDGERYQVRLPWSRSQPDLPVRIKQAMRQLTAVERRLARSDKDSRDNNQPYGSIWTTAWLNQHLNPVL
ncbi:Ribosomal protein uS12 methylthiotransferase RimO [Trichinella spiralis]|uniref:Ribosomal protein uS12 methylthiotransferase RimO n=1 Tax=Trichinella spiralis TaxID=6334 RepID=A0ABR3K2Y2_TRISP